MLILAQLAPLFALLLFAALLALLEVGRRVGARRIAEDPDHALDGLGAVDGAVFALLGLLVAFTFSGAADRFLERRMLVVGEANAIGTAWLRLDLLEQSDREQVQDLFREYVDARIAGYRHLTDSSHARRDFARSSALQTRIWRAAVAGCQRGNSERADTILLPALNEMFDITTVRANALQMHPPLLIYIVLALLACASAFLGGVAMSASKVRG